MSTGLNYIQRLSLALFVITSMLSASQAQTAFSNQQYCSKLGCFSNIIEFMERVETAHGRAVRDRALIGCEGVLVAQNTTKADYVVCVERYLK